MAKLARVIKKRALLRDSPLSMHLSPYGAYSKHIFTESKLVSGALFSPLDLGNSRLDGKSGPGVNMVSLSSWQHKIYEIFSSWFKADSRFE